MFPGSDGTHATAVARFQGFSNTTRGTALRTDGVADDATRTELIKLYMAQEGTSLPENATLQTHGCGPFHLATQTGPDVDEQQNRRVEVVISNPAAAAR